jgi:hypothetical protein
MPERNADWMARAERDLAQAEFIHAFLEAPVAVDVFPYTAQELAEKQELGDPFVGRILEEGILLGAH